MSRDPHNSNRSLRLMVVAGEESGDIHASGLVRSLRTRVPDIRLTGIGGKRLTELGLEPIATAEEMNVTGFFEVVARYPFLRSVMKTVRRRARDERPDAAVLVDYPGFNLRLAPYLSRLGIPVLYYVAPQLWAWREKRVRAMQKGVDRLVVLFPFEVEFFERHGIKTDWYGHPLARRIADDADMRKEGAAEIVGTDDRPLIAYLPGSRSSELKHHVEPMVRSAELLGNSFRHAIAVASSVAESQIRSLMPAAHIEFEFYGETESLLEAASAAVVKSGTSNLIAALIGTPFVSVYRSSGISYAIGKRLATVHWMSIVNILAGEMVVPELIQDDLQAEKVAPAVENLLDNHDVRSEIMARFREIESTLNRPDAYGGAAESLLSIVSGERKQNV